MKAPKHGKFPSCAMIIYEVYLCLGFAASSVESYSRAGVFQYLDGGWALWIRGWQAQWSNTESGSYMDTDRSEIEISLFG